MGLLWGAGALVGPPLAGLAMDAVPHGLAFFVAFACLAFLVFVGVRRSRDQTPSDRRG